MSSHPRIHISTERPTPIPQYSVEVTPPPYSEYDDTSLNSSEPALANPWGDRSPVEAPSDQYTRQRTYSAVEPSTRPLSRSISAGASSIMSQPTMAFPEPQIYRATSYAYANNHTPLSPISPGPITPIGPSSWNPQDALSPTIGPGATSLHHSPSMASLRSTASSYHQEEEDDYGAETYEDTTEDFSRELSNLSLVPKHPATLAFFDVNASISLDSEESLRRFQSGELLAKDEEWHLLVPAEAREALGKNEVQRQSVIFEVIKAERDYVADLQTMQEAGSLKTASPPIIPPDRLQLFLDEVFGNLPSLLAHHRRILEALFERQRDQHPLIQSVADIILEMVLSSDFRSDYEAYIKHYPLSESMHRRELRLNGAYKRFLADLPSKDPSFDPRIRKRDVITFISRPVTRLPRLNLVLEQILKLTDKEYEHPDIETLPLILSILGETLKSTQPGIAAAESKVKFWALCENLVFQRGEIIASTLFVNDYTHSKGLEQDMDLYDDSRTIVYDGPVFRQNRSDFDRTTWTELSASLLDNYFILTRDEKRSNGTERRTIMSRPLPLSYLRLGSFNGPPEQRKEKVDDGGLFRSTQTVPAYPFTIYHAGNMHSRRYTLYVATENVRKKWHDALVDALGVHKVRQEANQFFYQQTLTEKYFRTMGANVTSPAVRLTGKITTAAPFTSRGRRFLAVGCENGIYVAPMGAEEFHKVFNYMSPTTIKALQTQNTRAYNHLIIHSDANLLAYDLDAVALVSQGKAQARALEVMAERVISQDAGSVVSFNIGFWAHRGMVVCTTKKRLQTTTGLYAIEAIPAGKNGVQAARHNKGPVRSFKPYGEPAYVPRDASNITPLTKTVGVCVKEHIIVMDPLKLAGPPVNIVPNLDDQNDPLISILRNRVGDARPLGLMRFSEEELMVVYDLVGCYITKHGLPSRQAGYIKWETAATSFTYRKNFLLLFSPNFVEIRDVTTGRIMQVIEARDVRLLHSDLGPPDATHPQDNYNVIIALRGDRDDHKGTREKVVELVETSELSAGARNANGQTDTPVPALWDEWDM